jgi:hypothetical protein
VPAYLLPLPFRSLRLPTRRIRPAVKWIRSDARQGNDGFGDPLSLDSLAKEDRVRAATLSSSLISRILYADEERVLKIWFRDGPLYCYFDVPAEAFDALKASASPGRHDNAEIAAATTQTGDASAPQPDPALQLSIVFPEFRVPGISRN